MIIYHPYKNLKEAKLLTNLARAAVVCRGVKKWGGVRGRKKGENSKLTHFLRPNITKYCINLDKIFS